MFKPKQLKLYSHGYNQRHKKLSENARRNTNHFRRLNGYFEPEEWKDRLTKKQCELSN